MRLAVLIPFAVLGCGSKKAEDGPGSATAAKPPAVAAKVPAAAPVPQILCDKAIPAEVVNKHLTSAKADYGEPFDNGEGSFITSCRFVDDAIKQRTIVRYKCGPTFADLNKYAGAVEPHIQAADGGKFKFGRFDGVGRGGIRDKTSVAALHRELPCLVEVDEMGDREVPDWMPLLTDLEAALTPAAAATAP